MHTPELWQTANLRPYRLVDVPDVLERNISGLCRTGKKTPTKPVVSVSKKDYSLYTHNKAIEDKGLGQTQTLKLHMRDIRLAHTHLQTGC